MDQAYNPAYLYFSLFFLAVAMVFLAVLPSHHRLMLVSGLLSMPFALYSILFVPEYWQPQRLAVILTGLEDVIFSFANGVIVFGFSARILPPSIGQGAGALKPKLGRYLFLFTAAIPAVMVLTALGLDIMTAALTTGVPILAMCLYTCRGKSGALSLAGGMGFGVFYCLVLRVTFHLCPEMESWWAAGGLAGMRWWGMPLGEVLWALFFGTTWPLFVGWTLGWTAARFEDSPGRLAQGALSPQGSRLQRVENLSETYQK
ncbi:MAG: hypothetical protein PVG60_10390 [Desulfarculaceae bacterium]|jgi:hypothetical protein